MLLLFSIIVSFSFISCNDHTLFLVVGTAISSSDMFRPLTVSEGPLGNFILQETSYIKTEWYLLLLVIVRREDAIF